ncbi:MAG TPA: hypothetical protein VK760_04515, partial [Candidatus Acidoferrales bacterium]|nr:hypothetical protein [Candidatus Acidoferrales bacterium]
MRAAVFAFAGMATLAVAACGSGSSPVVPPVFSENASRVAAAGNAFAYGGQSVWRDVYTYPSPKPQPSTRTVTTISRSVKIASTSNPFGSGTVLDYATVENDATVFQQTAQTSDAY